MSAERGTAVGMPPGLLVKMKEKSDERIGALRAKLDACGPLDNRGLWMELDYQRGYRDCLSDLIHDASLVTRYEGRVVDPESEIGGRIVDAWNANGGKRA